MPLKVGTLVVRKGSKDKQTRIYVRVSTSYFRPSEGEVSQTLLDRIEELDGSDVEFEPIGGQPKQIRERGGTFISPARRSDSTPCRGRSGPGAAGSPSYPQGQREGREERSGSQVMSDFHNPYNFVPAPPRKGKRGELGDDSPVAQDAFAPDRYSGRIRVRMTAKTPLLVPDTENVQENNGGHKTFPLSVGPDGKPLIAASSVRGMLRAAYETITNSRFGQFSREQHEKRLAFRMDPREALTLIPARIEDGQVRLMTGTSQVRNDGRPNGPMYAAWLPRYDHDGRVANWAMRYASGNDPQHGDEVVCWIEKINHSGPNFFYWRVRKIVGGSDCTQLGVQPTSSPAGDKSAPVDPPVMKTVHGWVCISNANIKRKHDERVFFASGSPVTPGPFTLTDTHRSQWRTLIANYQSIHEEDIRRRRRAGHREDEYLGHDPGKTAWSRHVYTAADRYLVDGTLCYVRLSANRAGVDALFPVQIARELYQSSPWDLLPDSLKPASTISELSPADRVFGWVNSNKKGSGDGGSTAVRGLLRVGPVTCESKVDEAVQLFPGDEVPLAILAAPKPQQARFYVAQSQMGKAQTDGLSKSQAGYSHGKGLRGRKVYPHHAGLPGGHWDHPMDYRMQSGQSNPTQYKEYRRLRKNNEEQRDDQNRSVTGWVKAGAKFTFDLQVYNLSEIELGALLWLLKLREEYYFRFGGGKPLGFGSVQLAIYACSLSKSQDLAKRYERWNTPAALNFPCDTAIESFEQALREAYPPPTGKGVEDISFIAAFLAACRGFTDGLPVHYPRATDDGKHGPPSPDGKQFEWFVANEREHKLALPDLSDERGLPTLQRP